MQNIEYFLYALGMYLFKNEMDHFFSLYARNDFHLKPDDMSFGITPGSSNGEAGCL